MQAVEEQAAQIWGWMRCHRAWSAVMLIVLLAGLGIGVFWTVNLVRFGLPPAMGQNCGGISHSYYNQADRADVGLQPQTCFWRAYQTCQAATISQTYTTGIESWYTDTLTLELRFNHCAVYGHEDGYDNGDKHKIFLCNQVSKVGDTLQISACDGIQPFALIPRAIPAESFPCGVVGSTSSSFLKASPDIELCFFEAYKQCRAVSMGYQTLLDGQQVERNFYINTHCGIAYQRGSYQALCASLEWHTDGLHFLQCGTDGDIFIPKYLPLPSS